MKKLILSSFIFLSTYSFGIVGVPNIKYDLSDDLEESNTGGGLGTLTDGFDDPNVKVNTSGSQDYTPSLLGGQSLRFTSSGGAVRWESASAIKVDDFFIFNCVALPVSAGIIWRVADAGSNDQGDVYLYPSGQLKIFNGSSGGSQTTATLSTGTTYAIWAHWETNGTANVAFAAYTGSQTRPTTGTFYDSVSGGNGTAAIIRHEFNSPSIDCRFDRFRSLINGPLIGNNP